MPHIISEIKFNKVLLIIFSSKKKTASLALAFREDIFKMYVHNDIWDVTCVVPKNEYNIYYFPLRVLNLIQTSNSV